MNWHTLDTDEVLQKTGSSPNGLTQETVKQKLQEFGPNKLAEKKKKPVWLLFVSQFTDFMILVLIAAAIISGIAGDSVDTIIILVIVLLNAIIGFVQEYRAEKAMEALKKMATPQSTVLRDGHVSTIISTDLVPGDIVLLEAGNTVPADMRLLDIHSLKIMEASLTGESVAVDKNAAKLAEANLPLGDRINMAYKSTLVTNGRGRGVVIGTGMQTEIGHIAKLLQEEKTITPLQQRMADFGKKLSYLILLICIVLFGVGLLRGEEPVQMLLVAISLAVAAIPEALPALITIALSRGAARLVKQNVLIRKLTAVETLGSVTYICTDKTGTLTQNKMRLTSSEPAPDAPSPVDGMSLLELSMALNHTVIYEKEQLLGDPTELAMVEYIQNKFSPDKYQQLQDNYVRLGEIPFDSDRKCMTTLHRYNGQVLVITKGAVESIVDRLAGTTDDTIQVRATAMASEGLRVLAFGYRVLDSMPERLQEDEIEKGLRFAGLAGMIDPPREEIKEAIALCKTAGIKPVMITGDHKETAAAIGRQIGLLTEGEMVVTGTELAKMEKKGLEEKVEQIRVYARVSPDQKLAIVKALQEKAHFVAMTGDGVNDAPSLKKSNIGIAMGITGTDVTKEVSDMILLDDNFATIVKAIKEGRRIYDNIRRFVKYIMTCNSAEIWTIFLAPLLGLPIPLLPIHILWINLVTDSLPGLALSTEKAEKNIMQRPPRKTNESLFAEGIGFHIIWVGLLMAFLTLGMQAWSIRTGDMHWQTMVFTTLTFAQLAHVFAIRSDTEYIYKKGLFSNMPLVGAVIFTFLLQLGVIYLPFANPVFRTQPLSFQELLICMGVAVILFHAVELEKWIRRRRANKIENTGINEQVKKL
ncbi:MAG TPA: cation-translocating P-type ATPase [Flavisolibacter sp.]|jgi:Ca2+-transporting ATPase|nr:cation-translocating P-type ATPase [Flavisolibacter sp.]